MSNVKSTLLEKVTQRGDRLCFVCQPNTTSDQNIVPVFHVGGLHSLCRLRVLKEWLLDSIKNSISNILFLFDQRIPKRIFRRGCGLFCLNIHPTGICNNRPGPMRPLTFPTIAINGVLSPIFGSDGTRWSSIPVGPIKLGRTSLLRSDKNLCRGVFISL